MFNSTKRTPASKAVKLGEESVAATRRSGDDEELTYALDTYASALAEVGRFPEAVKFCRKALVRATEEESYLIRKNIANFENGKRSRYSRSDPHEIVSETIKP